MNKISDDNRTKELREHIRICLLELLNRSLTRSINERDYTTRLKSWSISLFILTVGFCLEKKCSLGVLYYILPFIPVCWFWFLNSYAIFTINRSIDTSKNYEIEKNISELYKLSYDELEKLAETIWSSKKPWPLKGKTNFQRFRKEKIPEIFKISLQQLPELFFFGGMATVWLLIILPDILKKLQEVFR